MSLGTVFSGALIMEIVFGFPGLGSLTIVAVYRNDYSMIMGIAIYSITTSKRSTASASTSTVSTMAKSAGTSASTTLLPNIIHSATTGW